MKTYVDSTDLPGSVARRRTTGSGGLTVWFTGLSAAGKSTLCHAVEGNLRALGHRVRILDSETLRRTMNRDLGFGRADRDENVARLASLARDLVQQGFVVLVAAISPYRLARDRARACTGGFLEVYVDAPLELCIRRDPKGLYAAVMLGELSGFTGIDDPYEPPISPEVHCKTAEEDVARCAAKVLASIEIALRGTKRR